MSAGAIPASGALVGIKNMKPKNIRTLQRITSNLAKSLQDVDKLRDEQGGINSTFHKALRLYIDSAYSTAIKWKLNCD